MKETKPETAEPTAAELTVAEPPRTEPAPPKPAGQAAVQQKHKDSIFRMLFKEKKNLLSLYNALNNTSYTDTDALEITTLENAIYMNYKNDVSFIFDSELLLYEHQSTVNPNMPLRDLIYVTKLLQGRIKDDDIYSSALIKLPMPRFVVFYNGQKKHPEQQVLRLSDAYEKKGEEPELELKVAVYNVNWGCNRKLMDACLILREYAQYVEKVREYSRKMGIAEAVENAVDYCINNGILKDFLLKNRAEAIEVCIYEYNEEKHLKSEREIWRKASEERFIKLLQLLEKEGRTEDRERAMNDDEYRKQLYREYNLIIPEQ